MVRHIPRSTPRGRQHERSHTSRYHESRSRPKWYRIPLRLRRLERKEHQCCNHRWSRWHPCRHRFHPSSGCCLGDTRTDRKALVAPHKSLPSKQNQRPQNYRLSLCTQSHQDLEHTHRRGSTHQQVMCNLQCHKLSLRLEIDRRQCCIGCHW